MKSSASESKPFQSRSKSEILGQARRKERLSQTFLIDSDAELFMYLIQCIRFGSRKVRRLNRAWGTCDFRYMFLPIHKLKQLLKGKACRYDALQLDATTLVTLRKGWACLKSCFQVSEWERFSYDLEKWFRSVFVIVSSPNGWKDQNIDSSFSRQRKPSHGEGIVGLANRVAVWRKSEVSIDF